MMKHLKANNLIPEEQIVGIADCYACIDQLLFNSMLQRNKNMPIAWIDYKKAFDSIPHDFDDVLINFFKKGVEKWTTNLHISSGDTEIISDGIKFISGILPGDCPSELHFVICLLPTASLHSFFLFLFITNCIST